ncbi:hypothetical protein [Fibrobacter sp.]|uniref:hypothetical protein n=1 Tax=Fibrobacter sp. TaxID=35828 RepID=UPI00389095DC
MSYVRKITLFVFLVAAVSFAKDGMWNRSPARLAETSFGIAFENRPRMDECLYGAFGEWGTPHFRIDFLSNYSIVDSLYRKVYSEINGGVNGDIFAVGAGYGNSVEWLQDGSFWDRHQLRFGAAAQMKSLSLRSWVRWFTDDEPEFWGGAYWDASDSFRLYARTDGSFLGVGTGLCFSLGCLESSYEFPGFSFSVGIRVALGNWNLSGNHGFEGEFLDWNAFSVVRKNKK